MRANSGPTSNGAKPYFMVAWTSSTIELGSPHNHKICWFAHLSIRDRGEFAPNLGLVNWGQTYSIIFSFSTPNVFFLVFKRFLFHFESAIFPRKNHWMSSAHMFTFRVLRIFRVILPYYIIMAWHWHTPNNAPPQAPADCRHPPEPIRGLRVIELSTSISSLPLTINIIWYDHQQSRFSSCSFSWTFKQLRQAWRTDGFSPGPDGVDFLAQFARDVFPCDRESRIPTAVRSSDVVDI